MKKRSSRSYTRREFVKLGVGLPLALATGCGGGSSNNNIQPPPPAQTITKVAIVSCRTYGSELQTAMATGADLLGGISTLVSGKVVTVKINLTNAGNFNGMFGKTAGETYITDGRTGLALARLLFANGATKVRFVDSVGMLLPLDQILTQAQWDVPALLAAGNVEFENTRNLGNGTAYVRRDVPSGKYMFDYFQLNHSYSDTDVFVSLAKMKQHLTAGVTLSMKCLFGCTPNSLYGVGAGTEDSIGYRGTLHGDYAPSITPPGIRTDVTITGAGARVPRIVADLNAARPVHLAIIDGITTISGGEGPWAPTAAPISPGVIIMGTNAVSTDAVAMAVMGYPDPRATRGTRPFQACDNHLLLADQAGVGTADLSKIEVRGLTIQQALCPFPG